MEPILDSSARGNMVLEAQVVAAYREHGVDTSLTQDRDSRRLTGVTVPGLEGRP